MSIFWTLLRRELGTFFLSLTGYVIIAAVTLICRLDVCDADPQHGHEAVCDAGDAAFFQQLHVSGCWSC